MLKQLSRLVGADSRVRNASVNPFINLPDELFLRISTYLDASDLLVLGRVCSEFKRIASDDSVWKELCSINRFPSLNESGYSRWKEWFFQVALHAVVVDPLHQDDAPYVGRAPRPRPHRVSPASSSSATSASRGAPRSRWRLACSQPSAGACFLSLSSPAAAPTDRRLAEP